MNEIEDNYAAEREAQYQRAVAYVIETQKVTTSYVQRFLQCGYNGAATHLDRMVEEKIITEPDDLGKRSVLIKPTP
jgi:S-DNA-T family DNA segregation ATPase FtsK/SpoIIIE